MNEQNTNYLKQWALEIIQLPEWLFLESYSSVGDLGETLSLILPPPENDIQKTLSQWMDELLQLKDKTDDEKKIYVTESWNGLDYTERFIFNKLIGGSFRIGVSKKLLITALSKYSEIDSSQLMHSIMGKWNVGDIAIHQVFGEGKVLKVEDDIIEVDFKDFGKKSLLGNHPKLSKKIGGN